MNGYTPYSPNNMYAPVQAAPLQPPLQDPDLLPSSDRYGTNGTTRQTPPSDALLHGYTAKLVNGTNYNGQVDGSPGRGRTSRLLDVHDPVAMHLLVETALGDSTTYDVLSFDEVERLKKELTVLTPRIESVRKRLALESKVRDAAASLNRLYRQGTSSSPSNQSKRRSSQSNSRKDRESISRTEDELSQANKKCADISRELYALETRQQKIQLKLLTHTAGVLQMTHRGPTAKRSLNDFPQTPRDMVNGVNGARPDSPASIYTYENSRNDLRRGDRDDFDERSLYRTPDEMYGFPFDGNTRTEKMMMKDIMSLGDRLEDLNSRLRGAIMESNFAQDVSPLEARREEGEAATFASVTRQIDSISRNFETYATSQSSLSQQCSQLQNALQQKSRQLDDAITQKDKQYEDVLEDRNRQLAIAQKKAEQLQFQLTDMTGQQEQMMSPELLPKIQYFNKQLYGLLNAAAAAGFKRQETPPPPSYDMSDPDAEVDYMEKAVGAMSKTYQDLLAAAQGEIERDAADRGKAEQMETVLTGLWTILLANEEDDRQRRKAAGEKDNNSFNPSEPFSLPGFSTRIQWLVTQAAELREQAQRNEAQYSTATKELQDRIAAMEASSGAELQAINSARDEREKKFAADLAAAQSGGERATVLQQQLDAKATELKQMEEVLETNRAVTAERQNTLQELRQKLTTQEEELAKAKTDNSKQIEDLETELVRLTTELTVAKAELDAAYGSRAERKAEANTETQRQLDEVNAELAALKASNTGPSGREKELEEELKDTLKEFEELTRASVEAEKERDKLEAVVDQIGSKLEEVEASLADEKIKTLGVKSPGEGGTTTETITVTNMRNDFKRMMREQRAEGLKALRVGIISVTAKDYELIAFYRLNRTNARRSRHSCGNSERNATVRRRAGSATSYRSARPDDPKHSCLSNSASACIDQPINRIGILCIPLSLG